MLAQARYSPQSGRLPRLGERCYTMSMRFLFDARYIRTDFHDGISRYSAELGRALAALTPVTFLIHHPDQARHLPADSQHVRIHAPTSAREPFTSLLLNKHHPDVVFSPLQTIGSWGRRFRLIITQQDMTYYKLPTPPAFLPPHVRAGWWLYHQAYWPGRLTLNRADMVATVSRTSRDEIRAAHLTRRPIVVVPNAAEDLSVHLNTRVIQQPAAPRNLIYMGACLPHKNVETLVRMLAHLPDRRLHILSRIAPDQRAALEALTPPGAEVVYHNGVSDAEYAHLLADHAIMVSASRAEGFGLPLAEALRLGVPAVVTDMPIFHEVAGQGAVFADPDDPADFARAIRQLDNQAARQALVKAGTAHVARFAWRTSAQQLLRAAQSLLQ